MRYFHSLVLAATLAGAWSAAAIGDNLTAVNDGFAPAVPGPLTSDCTHSFGSGNLIWCVSANGNLTKFISPAGAQIFPAGASNNEGYGLCYGAYTTDTWSLGWLEAGWGPTALVAKTTSSLTLSRTTANGLFTLLTKFSRDTNERDITIQMKLTNNGPAVEGVRLARFAEVGVDGDAGDDRYDASVDSLWARETHAAVASPRLGIGHTIWIGDILRLNCTPVAALPVPGGPGRVFFSDRFDIGHMNAGQSKIVYLVYRAE